MDNIEQEKQQEMLQELTALVEKMEKNIQKWHEIVNRQPTFSKQKQNEKGGCLLWSIHIRLVTYSIV